MAWRTNAKTTEAYYSSNYGVQRWSVADRSRNIYEAHLTETESIDGDGRGRESYHECQAIGTKFREKNFIFPGSPLDYYDIVKADGRLIYSIAKTEPYEWSTRPSGTTDLGTVPGSKVVEAVQDAAISVQASPITKMMNLPQAIIELKDLPSLVTSCKLIGQYLKGKRIPFKSIDTLKDAASMYLGWQFGVKPTTNDVRNFIGQVPDRVKLRVQQVRYKKGQPVRAGFSVYPDGARDRLLPASTAYRTSVTDYRGSGRTPALNAGAFTYSIASKGVVNTSSWPYGSADQYQVGTVDGVLFGRVAADYAADVSFLDDVSFNSGPLSTLWELTPFSFVVDWFANIGKWIEQANRLTAARRTGFRLQDGLWISQRTAKRLFRPKLSALHAVSIDPEYAPESPAYYRADVTMSKSVTWVEYKREFTYFRKPWGTVSLPKLNVRGFSEQGAFQASTGLALAINALR